MCFFFGKIVTFWTKTIGKILIFLKCDILPIFDITKLRGKKQQSLVYSRTGFWKIFIEKPGNFFFFPVKCHHVLTKKLGKICVPDINLTKFAKFLLNFAKF
jgi:hypothetical protein